MQRSNVIVQEPVSEHYRGSHDSPARQKSSARVHAWVDGEGEGASLPLSHPRGPCRSEGCVNPPTDRPASRDLPPLLTYALTHHLTVI
jgi:hypothetical protein